MNRADAEDTKDAQHSDCSMVFRSMRTGIVSSLALEH